MIDPYVYAGTDILRNKEGIRDPRELAAFERMATASRMETLPNDIPISADGYCPIHRYIFQDVYDWAGELRTIDIAKQGDLFCLALFVGTKLAKRFEAIGAEDYLMGLSESQFATRAAEHLSELNAIHPFREGNGRTLRAFLSILADQAGHPIELVRISPSDWNAASIESFRSGDAGPLRDAVANAISSSR